MDENELQDAHDQAQAPLSNPAHQVYFRAGLIACREYMARFVESLDPAIAQSIRANWWPQLGDDPGAPRLLHWNEVADGDEDGPWTQKEVSPSVEALPLAMLFLQA